MRLTVLLGMIALASSAGLAESRPVAPVGRPRESPPKRESGGERSTRRAVAAGRDPAGASGNTGERSDVGR